MTQIKGTKHGAYNKSDDGYNDLRFEIVLQAAKDYVWAREFVRDKKQEYRELCSQYPDRRNVPHKIYHQMLEYEYMENRIPDCESFFRGWWFQELAPELDGEQIIKRLRRTTRKALTKRIKNIKEESE